MKEEEFTTEDTEDTENKVAWAGKIVTPESARLLEP
jgi:hypothetical protein